jgi:hypothetical protein
MNSVLSVDHSLQLVAVRRITADDIKNGKVVDLGVGTPMKPEQISTGVSTAASPLLAPTTEQQAAAKANEKRQEAFARMKVELQAKKDIAS